MAKQLLFESEARQALKSGVDQLANAVRVTLGPKGRNVVINKQFGSPIITKDGVTVAKEIELPDPYENMGAQLVKEVASKTNDIAGDGTTTATVLAQAIVTEGFKNVTAGANPMSLKRGIDKATVAIIEHLKSISKEVLTKKEISQIGTISANNESEIGEFIANAMEKVGKDGVITVEESKTADTTLDVVEGMQFDRGYLSPYFVTNSETMEAISNDALILLSDAKISAMKDLLPILEKVSSAGKTLVIIAEDIDGEALTTLVINKLRKTIDVSAVKAPGFGDRRRDMLTDLAILTGGTVISEETGLKLETVTLEDLGSAKRVVTTKDATIIIEGGGDSANIKNRIALIRKQAKETPSDYDQERLQERLAKLAGGVAVLHVGAATETAMKEKKARVEDALHATRAAADEGIVAGGGVALIRCIEAIDAVKGIDSDEKVGINIMRKAIEEPLRQIAQNAGTEGSIVIQEVKNNKDNFGYNAATDKYEDLIKVGIIDPTKVTKTAVINAASIAGLLLTTEAIITDKKENAQGQPEMPQMPPGMPGMM